MDKALCTWNRARERSTEHPVETNPRDVLAGSSSHVAGDVVLLDTGHVGEKTAEAVQALS